MRQSAEEKSRVSHSCGSDKSPNGVRAKIHPFDSLWHGPENIEKGFHTFTPYYRWNYLHRLPKSREIDILVVSCGPGYFLKLLRDEGYQRVLGIDSDPAKIEIAESMGFDCMCVDAFSHLERNIDAYDLIILEQDINHLTKREIEVCLKLCQESLRAGGTLVLYGLNGSNPITGLSSLAEDFDHYSMLCESSFRQIMEYCGFHDIKVFGLNLYVFWKNPLNYLGLLMTTFISVVLRLLFLLYGKGNRIFTKKIGVMGRKPGDRLG